MFCSKFAKFATLLAIFSWGLAVSTAAAPVKIVTVMQDFASIAEAVGGEHVSARTLIKGSRNMHAINPKPSMVTKVRKADLVIRLGMDQDKWMNGVIQVARNAKVFVGQPGYIDASETIEKLEVPTGKLDGRHGDVHREGNPHYWLDPNNGKKIAMQIRDRLKVLDPDHAADYDENCQRFIAKLDEKILEWQAKMKPLQDVEIVTYHKVWSYFFEAFSLNNVGELERLPGIPPTTAHLADLQGRLSKSKAPKMVWVATFYPPHVGKTFAQRIDATFKRLPSNVDGAEIPNYIGLFDVLVEELTR